MVVIKHKYLISAITFSLSVLVYMFYKNHELELTLLNKKKQCDKRVQIMTEQHKRNLISLQQGIDRPLLAQSNASQSMNSKSTSEVQVSNQEISRETLGDYNESIQEIVAKKYAFLLKYVNIESEAYEKLNSLLLERERIALSLNDGKEYSDEIGVTKEEIREMERLLEEIDAQIEQLLDSENSDRYVMLKNSDVEQKQFNQYSLGVKGLFPLNDTQQELVIFARLKHKAVFENTIKTAGVYMDHPLTKEQSDNLLMKIERAAMRYKHGFLMEVRNVLDHDGFPMDQYTMLENYTNTEFKVIIENLRTTIAARGVIN
jgi:hypothetical protein